MSSSQPAWRLALWGGAAALLLLPAVAMLWTDEVQWTGFDFLIAGIVLALAATGIECALRATPARAMRIALVFAVIAALLLAWAALAVGIVGDGTGPIDLVFVLFLPLLVTALALRAWRASRAKAI